MSNIKLSILFVLAVVCAPALLIKALPAVQIGSRMFNSQDAEIGSFPYQVGIALAGSSTSPLARCGGSLIGNEWVLTAGHCVNGKDSVEVYLGSNIFAAADVHYKVDKKDFILHPDFIAFPIRNDIALIKIPYTKYSAYIRNIRLPALAEPYSSYEGETGIFSGWGLKTETEVSSKLQFERFKVISNEKCNRHFQMFPINSSGLCIETSGGVSPCVGDSGGPLVLESSKPIQIGVQSFVSGGGCDINWPAGFARVTSFLNWIKNHTNIYY